MIKMYVEYRSPNEIYFHHSVSYAENGIALKRKDEVHRQCEILYLISGKVQYKIDGETYDVSPGDIILVNMCELHSMYIAPSEPYERIVLQFSPHLIPNLTDLDPLEPFNNARIFRHILPKEFVEKTKILSLLKSIQRTCSKPSDMTDLKLTADIISIVYEINQTRERMQKSKESATPAASSVHKFSKLCTDYIKENITQRLTAKEIAKHLHVCESHLHHLFHKEMGMSLHVYILNQKMQLALFMLNSGKTPQTVAAALGYEYYSTFFNNFCSFFGHTPNQYDRTQRKHKMIVPREEQAPITAKNATPPPEKNQAES
jgi:AraC-like DNA-binding protein